MALGKPRDSRALVSSEPSRPPCSSGCDEQGVMCVMYSIRIRTSYGYMLLGGYTTRGVSNTAK